MHVEHLLRVALANLSSAGASKVIDLVQSDGEEDSGSVSEDSFEGDVSDICSSSNNNNIY